MNVNEKLVPISNNHMPEDFENLVMNHIAQNQENYISQIDTILNVENPVRTTNKLIEDQNSIILDLHNQIDSANKEVERIHYQLMKAVLKMRCS